MRFRSVAVGGLLLSVLACARGPGPGHPDYPHNATGAYLGRLVVEGERFDVALDLSTGGGGSVTGSFRVRGTFQVDGAVSGVIVDDLLRLTVTYRSAARAGCAGHIEGILTIEEGGGVLDGPVRISDCGDAVAGSMSFRR